MNKNLWTYAYDRNNNLIQETYQDWSGSDWRNIHNSTHDYDENNKIKSLYQHWDGFDWEDFYHDKYTYDENNNMIEDLYQYWHNSEWMTGRRNTYAYDINNNMIEDLYQNWKDSNWEDAVINTYTYDENNNLIEELSQWWMFTYWMNDSRATYSYIPITGIELDNNEIINYKLSNNYPNPFNPSTIISYDIPMKSNVTLKVYYVLGREVSMLVNKEQPQGNYKIEFDASTLTSGIYFYRIQVYSPGRAGEFVETKKMILLR